MATTDPIDSSSSSSRIFPVPEDWNPHLGSILFETIYVLTEIDVTQDLCVFCRRILMTRLIQRVWPQLEAEIAARASAAGRVGLGGAGISLHEPTFALRPGRRARLEGGIGISFHGILGLLPAEDAYDPFPIPLDHVAALRERRQPGWHADLVDRFCDLVVDRHDSSSSSSSSSSGAAPVFRETRDVWEQKMWYCLEGRSFLPAAMINPGSAGPAGRSDWADPAPVRDWFGEFANLIGRADEYRRTHSYTYDGERWISSPPEGPTCDCTVAKKDKWRDPSEETRATILLDGFSRALVYSQLWYLAEDHFDLACCAENGRPWPERMPRTATGQVLDSDADALGFALRVWRRPDLQASLRELEEDSVVPQLARDEAFLPRRRREEEEEKEEGDGEEGDINDNSNRYNRVVSVAEAREKTSKLLTTLLCDLFTWKHVHSTYPGRRARVRLVVDGEIDEWQAVKYRA